jgi:hypothetical protein
MLFRRTLAPAIGQSLPWRPAWWLKLQFTAHVTAWITRRLWRLGRWVVANWVGFVAVGGLWILMTGLADRRRWNVLFLLLLASVLWVAWQPRLAEGQRPVRSWRRKVWTYRREWQPILMLAGLAPHGLLPKLLRVRSTAVLDQLTVRLVDGQTVQDWVSRADRLAEGFGAVTCLVQPGRRRRTIVLQLTVPGLRDLPRDGQW